MDRLRLPIFLGFVLLAASLANAADSPIGFALYSWKNAANWSFSVFEGTGTLRSEETIRARKTTLKSLTFLKGRLASLPAGEMVFWQVDRSRGFILPSRETIEDLKRFSEGNQVTIVLPQDSIP